MAVRDLGQNSSSEQGCVFSVLRDSERVVLRNALAFALRDATPVSDLHTLVLPLRHAAAYFDLTRNEIAAANDLLWRLRAQILTADPSVEGFNIGANVGLAAGQTIIATFTSSLVAVATPRIPLGGVRGVIPDKMRY